MTQNHTDEKYQNRLIHEKSPYLLQHADNPVDWFPWGEEAFEKAEKEDKPIFLSIGYSTCHWCHVMEHESFENVEIANLINKYFVPVKVDREERPDIDNIYMSAVQTMTGQGGWPLTVFLTPEKEPFFGGTYFPPESKWGSQGIVDILESVHEAWSKNRRKLVESSKSITAMLKQAAQKNTPSELLKPSVLANAAIWIERNYDTVYGGFGNAPKFPMGHNLSFLLRSAYRTEVSADAKRILQMVETTLTKMYEGGIYDHLGGGFHRYSTDRQWQIPHFEKMLYDQAILSKAYLEAYQVTKDKLYSAVVHEVFEYVIRDMQDEKGGFYSAEDADSADPYEYGDMTLSDDTEVEKSEGSFYLWKKEEIEDLLSKDDAEVFNYVFGVKDNGNALSDPHNEFKDKNILFIKHGYEDAAKYFKKSEGEIKSIIEHSKKILFQKRETRPKSYLDDKIMTDWNGLMISSLAFGARVLNEERYKIAAEKAGRFILQNMLSSNGELLHRYRDGSAGIPGTLEDYAFFINGLIDLYEATFDIYYLEQAEQLSKKMIDLFWDKAQGGFYFVASTSEQLLFQQKEIYDGAIPSGNSMGILALIRLSKITLNKDLHQYIDQYFQTFSNAITQHPSAYCQNLIAFDFIVGPSQEIVIAEGEQWGEGENMLKAIYKRFIPAKVLIKHPHNLQEAQRVYKLSPFTENQKVIDERTTVYVCKNHVCQYPVSDLDKLEELLKNIDK